MTKYLVEKPGWLCFVISFERRMKRRRVEAMFLGVPSFAGNSRKMQTAQTFFVGEFPPAIDEFPIARQFARRINKE